MNRKNDKTYAVQIEVVVDKEPPQPYWFRVNLERLIHEYLVEQGYKPQVEVD